MFISYLLQITLINLFRYYTLYLLLDQVVIKISAIGKMVDKTVMGVIAAAVFILVGVALGPTITDSVSTINTTLLADVPLSGVIILLATYVPAFYYLAIVLGGIAMVWAATKSD